METPVCLRNAAVLSRTARSPCSFSFRVPPPGHVELLRASCSGQCWRRCSGNIAAVLHGHSSDCPIFIIIIIIVQNKIKGTYRPLEVKSCNVSE